MPEPAFLFNRLDVEHMMWLKLHTEVTFTFSAREIQTKVASNHVRKAPCDFQLNLSTFKFFEIWIFLKFKIMYSFIKNDEKMMFLTFNSSLSDVSPVKNAFYTRLYLYDAAFGSFQGGFNIEN